MPATANVPPSGDADINGLLTGVKWAVFQLTYSFPASGAFYGGFSYSADRENLNNFEALNSTQQTAARTALGLYASYTALTFSEVTESASVHGDLRLAESDDPSTAWAYFPSSSPVGGDVWINNSRNRYDAPVKGNYAYHTFIHELGHSLGLEHGHDASDGSAMTAAHDSMEYTVMTYRSYVGQPPNGYTNETWGYAQTPMMYDIAALQVMYGANYATNAGDTTYSWNPGTGEFSIDGVGQGAPGGNRVFMAVWDGGGTDTYEFSNYATAVSADLRPGAWTTMSQAQRAYLGGGNYAAGNVANALLFGGDVRSLIENVTGGSGNDTLTGNESGNRIRGGAGNDTLLGLGGNDTLLNDAGFDTMDGGADIDTADFSRFNWAVSVDLSRPDEAWTFDQPTLSGGTVHQIADLLNIENLTGSNFADWLRGDGNNNRLDGGAGNDIVAYAGGFDVLDGGSALDTASFLYFGSAVSVDLSRPDEAWTFDQPTLGGGTVHQIADLVNIENLLGSSFADWLRGDGNNNRLDGGAGNDIVAYAGGFDVLDGGSGIDTASFLYFGSAVSVDLSRLDEAWTFDQPTLTGGTVHQIADLVNVENLLGSSFADWLRGDGNNNRLEGGAGNDIVAYAGGFDVLDGGSGIDTASFLYFGSAVSVDLSRPDEAWTNDQPTLSGGVLRPIADLLNVENLLGSSFADSLTGDAGNNRLTGGAGNDTLTGGAGSDTFDYDNLNHGLDTIADFAPGAGNDTLDVHDVLPGFGGGSDINDFVRLSGGASTTVSVNANGSGSDFVALATLQNVAMTSSLLNELVANGNLVL